ncbi:MAG TPA: 2-deoxy-D-gluconate 3-dehydrogenase, partial [Porticoccaceae bacterium]|nr:2-deoxy-D-gluconate 3-dehydrogenase [Porticoccaceae bacterium]
MGFHSKVAIIAGGNGGLGLGIARGLAIAGAKIAVVGRNQEKIDRAVKTLEDQGADALGIACDVGDEASVNNMVATTAEHFGRIDILFNNAAISWGIHTEKMTLDEWNNFLTNNLTSTFLTCRACFPHMVEAGGGKIINVGSVITKLGFGKLSHYAAAKGGMDHM